MPVTGDTAQLQLLARQFSTVANSEGRGAMLKSVAQEGVRQVVLGFEQERDPFGRPWDALKHRMGKPLQDTGRLKNSFTHGGKATADGFSLSTDVGYARFHEEGTSRIPQRLMVPQNGELPERWAIDIANVVASYLRKHFQVVR